MENKNKIIIGSVSMLVILIILIIYYFKTKSNLTPDDPNVESLNKSINLKNNEITSLNSAITKQKEAINSAVKLRTDQQILISSATDTLTALKKLPGSSSSLDQSSSAKVTESIGKANAILNSTNNALNSGAIVITNLDKQLNTLNQQLNTLNDQLAILKGVPPGKIVTNLAGNYTIVNKFKSDNKADNVYLTGADAGLVRLMTNRPISNYIAGKMPSLDDGGDRVFWTLSPQSDGSYVIVNKSKSDTNVPNKYLANTNSSVSLIGNNNKNTFWTLIQQSNGSYIIVNKSNSDNKADNIFLTANGSLDYLNKDSNIGLFGNKLSNSGQAIFWHITPMPGAVSIPTPVVSMPVPTVTPTVKTPVPAPPTSNNINAASIQAPSWLGGYSGD